MLLFHIMKKNHEVINIFEYSVPFMSWMALGIDDILMALSVRKKFKITLPTLLRQQNMFNTMFLENFIATQNHSKYLQVQDQIFLGQVLLDSIYINPYSTTYEFLGNTLVCCRKQYGTSDFSKATLTFRPRIHNLASC